MTRLATAGSVLRVDFEALLRNYEMLCRQTTPTPVAAVVKADGYGLGAVRVARTLLQSGCTTFFVAVLDEAAVLKAGLPGKASVLVLNGLQPGAEEDCAALGAVPVLNSLDQLERWSALARRRGSRLPAALQVDSGMSRMGFSPEELLALSQRRDLLEPVKLVLLMSHLACADDPGDPANHDQTLRFEAIASHFPGVPRALDNSGGAFLARGHFDLVRAGIALYGGAPHGGENPMHPVIALEARIAQLRTISAGAEVGYARSFRAERETRIATIPVGYADGLPRALGNRGSAYISGHRAAMVGRVSMDSITLDVTEIPEALLRPGAPVELIGPHQSLDQLAADAGTISYEILTQLGRRYAREYLPATDRAMPDRQILRA